MRIFTSRIGRRSISILLALFALSTVGGALAEHGPVVVDVESGDCGETTISASVPGGTSTTNFFLFVDVDGDVEAVNVPTDGSDATVNVGPFYTQSPETVAIHWRVFGGPERNHDDPHWNGLGDPNHNAEIIAYGEANGWEWLSSGFDDPNPFINWYTLDVESCAITKDDCKHGGYADFGFRNQGLCIQFVNTGK